MSRLTKSNSDNVGREYSDGDMKCSNYCTSCGKGAGDCEYVVAMLQKLAAYEDTGITPPQIAKLQAESTRLREIEAQFDMYGGDDGITALCKENTCLRAERDAAVAAIQTVLHDEGEYCEEHCKTADCTGCVRASLFEWRGLEESGGK